MPNWSTTSAAIPPGNTGTKTTLAEMSRLAQAGARDPSVIAAAHGIVRGVPERDDMATMGAILDYVRARMRYTPDPLDVELVKSPAAILDECAKDPGGRFVGDCDDASVLLAALLGAVGIFSRFVVVPADPRRPGEWSHVYVSARTSDGKWVALDPIVRDFGVGQEAPASMLSGARAYYPGVAGLGGRTMRSGSAMYRRRGGVFGIGDSVIDPSTGNAYDPFSSDYSASGEAAYAAAHPGYGGSAPAAASGGTNSSISPTVQAILGVVGAAGGAYLASTQKGSAAVVPPRYSAVPIQQGGMSPTTKNLLIAGAVVVGGLLVFKLFSRR